MEGNAEGNEIRIVTSTDAKGRAVIETRDTCPGITEAVRSRIFEPFFLQPRAWEWRPLSVSRSAQNIVTAMDGEISLSSVASDGTSFVYELDTFNLGPTGFEIA